MKHKYIKPYYIDESTESLESDIAERILDFMNYIYKIYDRAQTDRILKKMINFRKPADEFKITGKILTKLKNNEFKQEGKYLLFKHKKRVDIEKATNYARKYLNP